MGSLPPQGSGTSIELLKSDENINVTSSFGTAFSINCEDVFDSVFTIRNNDSSLSLEYKVYASPKQVDTIPASNDGSWVNIIDRNSDPANYNHDKSKTIPPVTTFYESFSNKWGWVKIDMKTSSGTLTAKVWYRGTR